MFTHVGMYQANIAIASILGEPHGPGNEGLIKIVTDTDRNVIIGATTVGPHGGEMIAFLALAVHANIPVATLRQMIYAYPTFWRGIEDTLNQLG